MASCKYNPGINSVNPYAVLNVTQQSQNVSTNKTIVRYELLLYRPSTISSSASKAYSITINGTKVKSGTTTIGGSGTKTIASGTLEIPHNSDGTKSISFSFSLTFDITWHGKWVGTGTASGNMALTTIPRATTAVLTPSTVTLGSTISIRLPRASTSFTHNLYWRFGGLTGTIGTGIETSTSLKTSVDWASQIPNGNSGIGYIYCDTYNGGTKIGAKTVSFTASVSTGVEPVINDVTISEATSGIAYKFGGYVQNKSQLKILVDASGVQGATIKSYKVTVDGITYSNHSFTSSVLTTSGRQEVVTTVTDSRGMTATNTTYIDVMQYEPPRIDMFTVERGTSTSVPDAEGTYALMNINFTISNLNYRNDNSHTIEYKSREDSSWKRVGSYSGYNYNGTRNGGNILNEEKAYSFKLTVTDYFGSVEAEVDNISTAFTLLNINKSGQSMCFGGISERKSEEKAIDFKIGIYDAFGSKINNGLAVYSNNGYNRIDPNTTIEELIVTDINTPTGIMMYIHTLFYEEKSDTTNRAQYAFPYNKDGPMYYRYFYGGMWSSWKASGNEEISERELFGNYGHKCHLLKQGKICQISAYMIDNKMNTIPNTGAWNAISIMKLPSDYYPKRLYQGVLATDGEWTNGIKPMYMFEINPDGNVKLVTRTAPINWSGLGAGHGFAFSATYMTN